MAWTELDEVADRINRGVSRGGPGFDYSVPLTTAPNTTEAPEPGPVVHVHIHMPEQPAAAPAPAPAPMTAPYTSMPVWTGWVQGNLFTIIVVNGKRQTFQVYAASIDTWVMVGLFGLYMDALFDIQQWRLYFASGRTLADWMKANPEGIEPMLRKQ